MLRRFLNPFAPSRPIVVVSGLPRSGTSMLMQMLAAGGLETISDDVRKSDVNNPNGYYEFARVKKLREGDTRWLSAAQGRAIKIISALLEHLPNYFQYNIIFMQRDMAEILQSQQKMLKSLGEPTDRYSQEELARRYQVHLHTIMDWLNQQPNMAVLYMNHHDVIQDASAQAAKIEDFLQLGLDTRAMAAVVNAQLYRTKTPNAIREDR